MSNISLLTSRPERLSPTIEKTLRKDLGAPSPLTYQILSPQQGMAPTSLLKNHVTNMANKIALTSYKYSHVVLHITRYLQVCPFQQGSLLILHTLPRTIGLRETLGAGEVLQFAALIEAALT